jgi:hypothetical protein
VLFGARGAAGRLGWLKAVKPKPASARASPRPRAMSKARPGERSWRSSSRASAERLSGAGRKQSHCSTAHPVFPAGGWHRRDLPKARLGRREAFRPRRMCQPGYRSDDSAHSVTSRRTPRRCSPGRPTAGKVLPFSRAGLQSESAKVVLETFSQVGYI